ncbi:variable large family protein (plasmid) [Borrelia coriaceae]|uniref:Variable large protein n=1 Tax=Borrelia coriaceae ATCC 43381 TaxID=1408429 RepID=W5SWY5_9SPIR|nr:variable large family protein [Borrelia coriaceae]AHH11367.1 Variable outer membrane protein [Borrelia coriaceae ATCC 43381]UPA17507.1 variable large family protein [Borrelia coriaceae]
MRINIKNIKVKSICATLFISLFLSCNNGVIEELEKRNQFLSSLANLGNDFLSVFASFGDSLGGVLGFNKDTKKSEVGDYFKKVKETVEGIKGKLNAIVENMRSANNPNVNRVNNAVNELVDEKFEKIIRGASDAEKGANGEKLLGNIDGSNVGVVGDGMESLIKGIQLIVEVVLKDKGNPDAGTDKRAEDGGTRTSGTAAGKLFDSNNAGSSTAAKKSATDAAKAVGAVTGADILKAIATGPEGKAATIAKYNTGNGNAADNKNDAVIAGGIALRAMAKGGKFANASDSDSDYADAVKGAAVSAVTKALNTLTIAIRKTINEGLKTVKEAMKINPSDTPVTIEDGISN